MLVICSALMLGYASSRPMLMFFHDATSTKFLSTCHDCREGSGHSLPYWVHMHTVPKSVSYSEHLVKTTLVLSRSNIAAYSCKPTNDLISHSKTGNYHSKANAAYRRIKYSPSEWNQHQDPQQPLESTILTRRSGTEGRSP